MHPVDEGATALSRFIPSSANWALLGGAPPVTNFLLPCLSLWPRRLLRLLGTGSELKGLPGTGQTLLPVHRLRQSWEHTPHGLVCVTGAFQPSPALSPGVKLMTCLESD